MYLKKLCGLSLCSILLFACGNQGSIEPNTQVENNVQSQQASNGWKLMPDTYNQTIINAGSEFQRIFGILYTTQPYTNQKYIDDDPLPNPDPKPKKPTYKKITRLVGRYIDNNFTLEAFRTKNLGFRHLGTQMYITSADDSMISNMAGNIYWSPYSEGRIDELPKKSMISNPVLTKREVRHTDVFAWGRDNKLWYSNIQNFSGNWKEDWKPWVDLGGVLSSKPSVVSWDYKNRLDVFVRGVEHNLWHKWSGDGGKTWSGWINLGGVLKSAPTVVSRKENSLDVVVYGVENKLWRKTWTGQHWTGWIEMGYGPSSAENPILWPAPAVSHIKHNNQDFLAVFTNHNKNIYQKSFPVNE